MDVPQHPLIPRHVPFSSTTDKLLKVVVLRSCGQGENVMECALSMHMMNFRGPDLYVPCRNASAHTTSGLLVPKQLMKLEILSCSLQSSCVACAATFEMRGPRYQLGLGPGRMRAANKAPSHGTSGILPKLLTARPKWNQTRPRCACAVPWRVVCKYTYMAHVNLLHRHHLPGLFKITISSLPICSVPTQIAISSA